MPVLQWSATHVVYRPANMHQNALIFVVPAVALLTPWMQNLFKIVENHRWQHVICRRSCPPRGGPIRSVYGRYEKCRENTSKCAPAVPCCQRADFGRRRPLAGRHLRRLDDCLLGRHGVGRLRRGSLRTFFSERGGSERASASSVNDVHLYVEVY